MPSVDELLNESLFELSESETWERVEGYDISEYFSDEQQMVQIDSKNRTIGSLSENVSVFEENNSQYITFIMDRYLDGIDLSTKTFNVQYENKSENIWGSNNPVDFYRSETKIKFGWLVNNVATQKPIVLDIIVFCIGYVDTNEYVFKTRPMQYTIYNSNEIGGGEEHRPDESWYIQFMEQQIALVNESKGYRNEAAQSASSANTSMLSATESKRLASGYAPSASQSANSASQSSTSAATDATKAQSYAVGGTGTREGEDTDNAKYYYEETRSISPTGVDERLNALEDKTEVLGSVKTIDFSPSIEFDDGLAVDAKDVKVAFEPQQDLHGYDKPWAGGAGKNKAEPYTRNSYGTKVEFEELTGSITASGTSTDSSIASGVIWEHTLKAGSYILSGNGLNTNLKVYNGWDWIADVSDTGATFTLSNDSTIRIGKYLSSGTSLSYNITEFMIRLATETDATFEPYSNECPIEGYTECEVEVTGKNLCYGTVHGYVETTFINVNNNAESAIFYAVKGQTYTLSSTATMNLSRLGRVDTPNVENATTVYEYVALADSINTWQATWTGWTVWYKCNSSQPNFVSSVQIELGSTATAYVLYQSTTYTIDLNGTRYGGKVDLVTGEMRVTHGIETFDGSSDEGWLYYSVDSKRIRTNVLNGIMSDEESSSDNKSVISNEFPTKSNAETYAGNIGVSAGAGTLFVADGSSEMSKESFTTFLASNPLQICYELATPFTVQLTPEQIRTLEGTNNITTNMDTIAIEYYGVDSAIGVLQNQLDEVKEVTIRVPEPPGTNGNYVLSVTVSDSGNSYAWVSN